MSMHFLKPGCADECPACPHRTLNSRESLVRKQDWVVRRLEEYAGVVEPIRSVSEKKRWNYRKKVCLAAEYKGTSWNIGVRRRDSIIPVHNCPVHHPEVNQNINLFSHTIPGPERFPLVYYMQSGAQLSLVVKCRNMPDLDWLTDDTYLILKKQGVEGLWLHLHPDAGKKVTGKAGWHLVAGNSRSLNENGLVYGPASFQQVMPDLYADSLQEATGFLDPGTQSAIIDLYCGMGTSLRQWMDSGTQAIGVELSGEAITCAVQNAPGSVLLRGACKHRIPQLLEFANSAVCFNKEISVYANPPRTGMETDVTSWIARELRPRKIAYLSCSAGTLYRDLIYLGKHGYAPLKIIPYDFFPHTLHVEMLAFIQRET